MIFVSPLLVEDGVFDIANHHFRFAVTGIPVLLIANILFVVLMTYALLEWTGRDQAESHYLFVVNAVFRLGVGAFGVPRV